MTTEDYDDFTEEDRYGYTYRCFGCGAKSDGPWCGCEAGKRRMSEQELADYGFDEDGNKLPRCYQKGCLEVGTHHCDDCEEMFCEEHGQKGGDRQVQDVGAVAYPALCDGCRHASV
jgi:hypothetical protein